MYTLKEKILIRGSKIYRGIQSSFNYRKLKKYDKSKGKSDKIRVAFICQYIPSWCKVEAIYRKMLESELFEPYLICVPSGIHNRELDDPKDMSNDTYEYYINNGYDAVNALIGENEWLDIKSMGFEYVIYTRPYNICYPVPYTSHEVSKYAHVCVVLYAATLIEVSYDSTMNADFFNNVDFYFSENPYAQKKCEERYRRKVKKNQMHPVFLGAPGFESMEEAQDVKTDIWDFSDGEFRLMWTPRWTTDKESGGSNFFLYKDWMLKYSKGNLDTTILMRPHPLMFEYLINHNEMSEAEVEEYKSMVEQIGNLRFDSEKEYMPTMWQSSVLISDVSAIMLDYLLTGKPIVYCAACKEAILTENMHRLIDACYTVNNESELEQILKKLREGDDPKKEIRKTVCDELLGANLSLASQKVLEKLEESWRGR